MNNENNLRKKVCSDENRAFLALSRNNCSFTTVLLSGVFQVDYRHFCSILLYLDMLRKMFQKQRDTSEIKPKSKGRKFFSKFFILNVLRYI